MREIFDFILTGEDPHLLRRRRSILSGFARLANRETELAEQVAAWG